MAQFTMHFDTEENLKTAHAKLARRFPQAVIINDSTNPLALSLDLSQNETYSDVNNYVRREGIQGVESFNRTQLTQNRAPGA